KEEEEFLAARTDALAQGTTWQRIADLIELSDSRSKTNTRSTKDLGRMKEIILSLKREGESAPGASDGFNVLQSTVGRCLSLLLNVELSLAL
ncbi:hypothetical protein BT69DRAFT_1344075, partial [Atractiella rhizophila]